MKTMNAKIPVSNTLDMSERAELNAYFMSGFITTYIDCEISDQPIDELTFNYTFKAEDSLHKLVKLKAIEKDLPMNEFIGRLIARYY